MMRSLPIERARDQPVAVIDIGSNSIRLVVYRRLSRAPQALFNEKVLCGLGRRLNDTGRLDPDGVAMALVNLQRFAHLLAAMGVVHVDVLATAAVRDADDGGVFVDEVKRRCGFDVSVISGPEEARLAAMGVVCGIPGADGVAGDLGGGSLELVALDGGEAREHATLPLGPFRLMDVGATLADREAEIDRHLDRLDWLSAYGGRSLYAVGGNWRALARTQMVREDYPLQVIHQYTVPAASLNTLTGLLGRQKKGSLARMAGVSRRRLETLPAGALVMARLLARLAPKDVVFSALGVREGHLFDLLPADRQASDPLLLAAGDLARRLGRFDHGDGVVEWTERLFPGEPPHARRLRHAACLLGDCCWAEHPDHRAEQAVTWMLHLPILAVEHAERAFLAAVLHARYAGDLPALDGSLRCLGEAEASRALTLGLTLRLAFTLTGGAVRLLGGTALSRDNGTLVLALPAALEAMVGDVVRRRLEAIGKALGEPVRIDLGAEEQPRQTG